jgi:hypothetical protein
VAAYLLITVMAPIFNLESYRCLYSVSSKQKRKKIKKASDRISWVWAIMVVWMIGGVKSQ